MYPDILHTGKKVPLQIRIDHKMFDKFTSRNVKKIFKYPLSRPTTMSEQIVRLKRVLTLKFVRHFSGVSRTFWEKYVRPESMIIDTLGVYCMFTSLFFFATSQVLLVVEKVNFQPWFMVLNVSFNNISVILLRSAFLVEETGVPRGNHRPAIVTDKLYHIMLY